MSIEFINKKYLENNSYEDKQGLNIGSEGAGDQGLMFGFACDENEEMIYLLPSLTSLRYQPLVRLSSFRPRCSLIYTLQFHKTFA